ncbi:MAG: right-handed parallel beta-helix repeat-containing protein [Aureliella sp.]
MITQRPVRSFLLTLCLSFIAHPVLALQEDSSSQNEQQVENNPDESSDPNGESNDSGESSDQGSDVTDEEGDGGTLTEWGAGEALARLNQAREDTLTELLSQLSGTVLYVRKSGDDSNDGLSPQNAFRTIQQALRSLQGTTTIVIGAGEYEEELYASYSTANRGNLVIIGDVLGQATGDRGNVTIRCGAGKWGMRIYYPRELAVAGLTFVAASEETNCYGFYTHGSEQRVAVTGCRFEGLRYGSYISHAPESVVHACDYERGIESALFSHGGDRQVTGCLFNNASHGVVAWDGDRIEVNECEFSANELAADQRTISHHGVRVYRCDLKVDECHMVNLRYSVYGHTLRTGEFEDIHIENPLYWGVVASGDGLSASDILVEGEGINRGSGIRLDEQGEGIAKLKNVTCTGLHNGFVAFDSEYEYDGLTVTSNRVGIRVYYYTPEFTLASDDGITCGDNYVGVHISSRVDEPCQATIRNFNFRDNDFGLVDWRTNLTLENCRFEENAIGVRSHHSVSVTVRDCEFVNNLHRREWHHWGLQIHSHETTVEDCLFEDNWTGLRLHNLTDSNPTFRNLTFKNNERTGLRVYYGDLNLDASNNISIEGSRHGIVTQYTDCIYEALPHQPNVMYPYLHYDGALTMRNLDISGAHVGIHCNRASNVDISDVRVHDTTHIGVHLYYPQIANVVRVTSEKNRHHGFHIIEPADATFTDCSAIDNGSHGFYSRKTQSQHATNLTVSNSVFQGNTYGFRTIGLPCDNDHHVGNSILNNNHGLRIERAPLQLDSNSQMTITGNRYGVMSYHGELNLQDWNTEQNEVGVYSYNSLTNLRNCEISVSNYGVISYSDRTTIADCDITGGRFGVYLSPRLRADNEIVLSNLELQNFEHNAIHVHSHADWIAKVRLEDITVNNAKNGIVSYRSELDVDRFNVTNSLHHGFHQNRGKVSYRNVRIDGAGSWGVNTYLGDIELVNCKVDANYGLLIRNDNAKIVNSVVDGGIYGLLTSNANGRFDVFQTTFGNISHYGVRHDSGNLVMRNCIVDAGHIGMWNRATTGTFEHDYNLIATDRTPYVNSLPGENEIEKEPIFRDPVAGDLRLAAGSPAINSGTDMSGVTLVDMEGNARPAFRQFEMGAYEYTEESGSLRILEWDEVAN